MSDPLDQRLNQRAAEHRRRSNGEILVHLEQVIAATSPDTRALLARADALRTALRVPPLTDAGLHAAKSRGRL